MEYASGPKSLPAGQNSGQMWHGRNLVAAAMKTGGEEALHDIVRRFRQSFKDVLHPKFMPVAWEVDHRQVDLMA